VKTLAQVTCKVEVGDKRIPMDSTLLFSRLLVIVQRCPDIEPFFQYELTAVPTAIFKGASMRKANKSLLGKELKANAKACASSNKTSAFVIDGGWLVHKVKWQSCCTYAELAELYVNYVGRHFGHRVTVVFDGYGNEPTIKDHEHTRRSVKSAPNIAVDEAKPLYSNQAAFLANKGNKKALIQLLAKYLTAAGHEVHQARDDADTLIVSHVLQIARTQCVTAVASDNDILILLLYHFQSELADIFLHCEVKHNTEVISIRIVRDAIGDTACRQLLVAHAIGGCDSTSAVYGHGKVSVYRKVIHNHETLNLTDVVFTI